MYQFVALNIIQFVLTTIIANAETNISEGLKLFAILSLINELIGCTLSFVSNYYSMKLVTDYHKTQLEKYSKMSKASKEKDTIESFMEKMTRAQWAIRSKYTWGVTSVMLLISSVCNFFFIISVNRQYKILVLFVFVHICWYLFVTKNMVNQLDKKNKTMREKRKEIHDLQSLLTKKLHNGQCEVFKVMKNKEENEILMNEINNYWSITSSLQKVPNFIIIFFVSFIIKKELSIVLYIICNNVTKSISAFLNYANQYKTNQNDIEEINNFWIDKNFDADYTQLLIPCTLKFWCAVENIISVNFTHPLTINKYEKILIRGKTGSGKTTLLKALLGHILGGHYDSGDNPLSYDKKIQYMCQKARESVTVVNIKLRQLFDDEPNNESILKFLEIVGLSKWYSETIKGLDIPIGNKISGGQHTRLCIAITLYNAQNRNAQWIILDEPDAGIDSEDCPNLMKDIINAFPRVTIFFIVHLCDCQLEKIGIKKEWRVENGTVTELNYDIKV